MSTSEEQLEELRRENANQPKPSRYTGKVYNPITDIFTAPRRGLYYFTCNGFDYHQATTIGVALYHNYKAVMGSGVYKDDLVNVHFSNAMILQLEESDVVFARLPTNHQLYDDGNNRCTLTGFLLFPL